VNRAKTVMRASHAHIKEEEVDLSEYHDSPTLIGKSGVSSMMLQHKRIHSRGYLTPLEFEQQWRLEHSSFGSPSLQALDLSGG